jgi:iron(III) transport system permease protein
MKLLRTKKLGRRAGAGQLLLVVTIVVIGGYLIAPTLILLVMSFNGADSLFTGDPQWGLDNWREAWSQPNLLSSILNSLKVWLGVSVISLPIAIGISLLLARTNMPRSRGLELMFWVALIFPPLSSIFGWVYLLNPDWGFLNVALGSLPFIKEGGPFNVYSYWGIVFVRLMADGIAYYVVLLTPAFRNMDGALEEAARVSGSSSFKTMIRVTLPIMAAPLVLVISLQLIRIFQGFEVEYILGARIGFWVYSTLIYNLVRIQTVPQYGPAIVLAVITFGVIALVVPFQNWVIGRRQYTTVDTNYRPGLIDLGRWKIPAFTAVAVIISLLTIVPVAVVAMGSFMTRVGWFSIPSVWTLDHWRFVFESRQFIDAFRTTLLLSTVASILSPLLFSVLAYQIVRTRLRGRKILDTAIWSSAGIPGILAGLGLLILFLTVPWLRWMFGTIWPLLIVVIIAGKTTGTNVFKGVLVQLGASLEEVARVSGAGWTRTYFRVVLPILMPTMVLIGMLNFVGAANTTSSIILLASRKTTTLSILGLQWGSGTVDQIEAAGIISLIIMAMSLTLALPMRSLARRLGVRQDMHV